MRRAVAMCLALAAGCAAPPSAPRLPPEPAETVNTAYFNLPSDVAALHSAAAGRIWNELAPRFRGLERQSRMLRPGTRQDAIVAHYVRALPGWSAIRIDAQPRGGWAFALTQSDCVVAVMAMRVAADAPEPAAILSNLKRGNTRLAEPADDERPRSCG